MTATVTASKLDAYVRLVRLDKPVGFMLLMWPTLWGLWIASDGKPTLLHVFIFVFGTILMRSAGCAINDWADRDFDGAVKRTAARPLASGEITGKEAIWVAIVCALAAALLLIPLNWPARLWALPALAIAAIYPFTKRFFAVPQAILGVAFSMGVPMAFAAVRGEVPTLVWLLMLANFFWVLAYDTEYAMVDRDDDIRIGIKTSALFFGKYDVLAVSFCYFAFLGLMAWVGQIVEFGTAYYVTLLASALIAMHHIWLIKGRERDKCFIAFRANNTFGMVVFVGVVVDYAMRLRGLPLSL